MHVYEKPTGPNAGKFLQAALAGKSRSFRQILDDCCDPVLELIMDAVHRYVGYVVQSTGDGIFPLFGVQVAHEDHPQRPLHAAIAARTELLRWSAQTT